MFSPLNDPIVTDWFRRLDAAWKRMPPDEQTRQREEVQQHLEGLVAAKVAAGQSPKDAWNAALVQFGNPAQIGRKMYYEWRLSKTGFRAEAAAVTFSMGCQVVVLAAWTVLINVWQNEHHNQPFTSIVSLLASFLSFGVLAVLYAALGRKYPFQAIKGAFYGNLLGAICNWMTLGGLFAYRHLPVQPPLSAFIDHSLLWLSPWLAGKVAVAYLGSVTKRGWYKPTWEDFKLTLPKRRIVG